MNIRLKMSGIAELEMRIATLERSAPGVAKACLYEGARVLADSLRAAVSTIPTQEHHAVPNAPNGRQLVYMTPEEKAACLAGIGIAKFQGDIGHFETAVGFEGYQTTATSEGYPYGIPVPMLMRSIEIGSSVRAKYPIIRKALKGAEGGALAAMQAKFDEIIEKIMR